MSLQFQTHTKRLMVQLHNYALPQCENIVFLGGGDDYLGCQRLFLVTIASASNFVFCPTFILYLNQMENFC